MLLFQENTTWNLKDGSRICFWHDSWTDMGPLYQVHPRFYALSNRKNMTVLDAWDSTSSSWNLYPRRPLLDREICSQEDMVSSLPIPSISGGVDTLLWNHHSQGLFSIASAKDLYWQPSYEDQPQDLSVIFSNLWRAPFPKKSNSSFGLLCIGG